VLCGAALRRQPSTLMFWTLLAAVCVSLTLTWVLRRYALTRSSLIDLPNERSSHRNPTPRGGGVAIAIAFLGLLPTLWVDGTLTASLFIPLFGAGGLIAFVGFLDDHHPLPASWRLVSHFAAAAWVVGWSGGMPPLTFAGVHLSSVWLSSVVATVYVVWLLNLYNFMDGIDGIASIESMTVCVGGILLYLIATPGTQNWASPALLTASVAGFGYWNFPPARIFMGDSGSGFLGVTLGAFSIQAAWVAPELFWAWTILLGVFIADATVTLTRRVWRGHRYDQAHRSHAYQHAARRFGSHKSISLAVGAINLLWLLPLALLVTLGYVDASLGLLIAYAPLVWLVLALRAGAPEAQL
jgi:Fuc2NAc and GlcNAc transferase